MTKTITNKGQWKDGQSGNRKGRPAKGGALTEMLRLRGKEFVYIGGLELTAEDALARAVWEFALHGEVWLGGKRLEARNVTEWANVVKWLYSHIEPVKVIEAEQEPEMIVRVIRADKEESEPQIFEFREGE